jgi:hypothetical protein
MEHHHSPAASRSRIAAGREHSYLCDWVYRGLFLSNVALLIGAEINSVIEEVMRGPTVDGLRAQPPEAPTPWSPA